MIGAALWGNLRATRFGVAAVLLFAAAGVLGWRSGKANDVPAAHVAPAPWVLPHVEPANSERDVAILRTRRPWGGGGAFRDIDSMPVVPVAQPWTLVGTIVRDDRRFALIEVGPPPAGKLEYRVLGDKLPDGSTLDAIDGDSVTTAGGPRAGARSVVYRLFQKKS